VRSNSLVAPTLPFTLLLAVMVCSFLTDIQFAHYIKTVFNINQAAAIHLGWEWRRARERQDGVGECLSHCRVVAVCRYPMWCRSPAVSRTPRPASMGQGRRGSAGQFIAHPNKLPLLELRLVFCVSGAAIGSGAGDALRRLKKAFSVSNLPVFLEALGTMFYPH
jgi:hypothetical protein